MKLIALVLTCTVLGGQAPPPNPAVVMTAFLERAKAYADLRDSLAKGDARQTRTGHPEKLDERQKLLAARIEAARPHAKMGDLFTAETRPIFRKLLSPQLKGSEGVENRASINDEADETGAIRIKVNAPYPEGEPLASVPPDILRALPVLPKDLEYRFVRKNLILYDARSNLIVDVMPNAIP